MKTEIDKARFIALEDQFWTAIRERDGAAASRLSADTCLLVGGEGVRCIPRQALAGMVDEPPAELTDYEIDEDSFQASELAPGLVAVAYRVRSSMVVKDKPLSLEAYDSSTWRQGAADEWVCVMHTESLSGNPLGLKQPTGQ